MELLLRPYINTAALQGPTALGKGPERSAGAFSLPFASPTRGTVDGAEGSLSWLGHRGSNPISSCTVSLQWATNTLGQEGACIGPAPGAVGAKLCFMCRNGCWREAAAGSQGCPKPSAVFLGSGRGICRQQGHSCSATALSRFAEHGVSGMCWVPACRTGRTGRINSLFPGI